MSREHAIDVYQRGVGERFGMEAKRLAKQYLPQPVQDFIISAKYGGLTRLKKGPTLVQVGGCEATFYRENRTDLYRLNPKFEGRFFEEFLEIVNLTKGSVVDVGSAQGLYSLMGAMAGAEKVYAIDPDPLSIGAIKRNISFNPNIKEKIEVLGVALGAENGTARLNVDYKGRSAPSMEKTFDTLSDQVIIPIKRYDDLVKDGSISKRVSAVKIDVEGAECGVIQGMDSILSGEDRPGHLFVEVHPKFLPKFGSNTEELIESVVNHGYDAHRVPVEGREEFYYHFIA